MGLTDLLRRAAAKPNDIDHISLFGTPLSLGALTMLTGCDISDTDAVQSALHAVSRWNDMVQEALFSPQRLAPTYTAADIAPDYRFNAYFGADQSPPYDPATYRLELAGLISDKRPWTVEQFKALPQTTQITRHICVEGWSYVGQWGGPKLADFLAHIGADTKAAFVGYTCADGYYGSIDMATALHPQTIIALDAATGPLPTPYGAPFKIRMPTKLGFKNPKWLTALYVTNRNPGGFWDDRGYNWFSGL
jgi:DMSO/TMAO reductase YedYZ molybdopterin-dependent catalytic subunit